MLIQRQIIPEDEWFWVIITHPNGYTEEMWIEEAYAYGYLTGLEFNHFNHPFIVDDEFKEFLDFKVLVGFIGDEVIPIMQQQLFNTTNRSSK